MKEWLQRFKNGGTIVALAGAIGIVLQQFGFNIDMTWLNNTATAICTVLIILGIVNVPTTPGMDNPFKKEPDAN